VFFNTLSLLFPAIGHKFNIWWLDPVGAALLSVFIIIDWSSTCFDNVVRLSGSAADERLTQKVLFLAYRFSSLVDGFKSVVAYHAGDGIWVEIDILMDPQEKLVKAHDIAETLQYCLEGLQEVDRAFVAVDCQWSPFSWPVDHANCDRYIPGSHRTQRRRSMKLSALDTLGDMASIKHRLDVKSKISKHRIRFGPPARLGRSCLMRTFSVIV
jgi:hypothetical protein